MQPFEIKPERVEKATQLFSEKVRQLNQPELNTMMIVSELGLYEHMRFTPEGEVELDLTDLQWVAVAAAAAAVAEVGGYLSDNPDERLHVILQKASL